MNGKQLSMTLSALAGALVWLAAAPAEAGGGQATMPNAPAALAPGQTNTVHELGASLNANFNPDAFTPAFNWRFHLPSTGRIGQLSGLYMGLNAGPAVHFWGGGRRGYYRYRDDFSYRDVWGRAGFELGYEIDPWSNLALTLSPVVHNDFHFSPHFFQFEQTFGPAIRLYIEKHWVVYFEPGFVGWNLWTDGRDYTSAGFSLRGGVGFAYKF